MLEIISCCFSIVTYSAEAYCTEPLLPWRRASIFCKAPLKKSTSSVLSASSRFRSRITIEAGAAHASQLTHALDTQAALHRHHFPESNVAIASRCKAQPLRFAQQAGPLVLHQTVWVHFAARWVSVS